MVLCDIGCYFSFLILFESFLFLVSLTKNLSILFSIKKKKTKSWFHRSIPLGFFISIVYPLSSLFISFLLMTLSFVHSFLILLGWVVWEFWFLSKACITVNFPLRAAFAAFHRLWRAVFPFYFVSRCFLIYSLISSWTLFFFLASCLFSMFVFFPFFFL